MLLLWDFKIIKLQNNYCFIGVCLILIILYYYWFFLVKLFIDDIDIGKYWMFFLNLMEEYVFIGELSGGGGVQSSNIIQVFV